jgi:hypothetical protein
MNGSEPFRHFWTIFAVIAALSTLWVFTCMGFRSGMAFSSRNATPRSTILLAHASFLLALLALSWITVLVFPHLPGWATEKWIPTRHNRASDFDLVCLAFLVSMAILEHRNIYREAETDGGESP